MKLKSKIVLGAIALNILLGCAALLVYYQNEGVPVINTRVKKSIDSNERAGEEKKTIDFDDWYNGIFRYKTLYPNWLTGSEYVTRSSDGSLVLTNIETEVESELLAAEAWTGTSNPSSYSVSADQKYAVITHDPTDGYAHYVRTFSCDFYDLETGNKLDIPGLPSENIQKLKWSTSGHSFSYVYGFNVYVVTDFATGPYQVTSDGDEQLVFNGITDWLFSVEITDDDALMWWSPDSSFLAIGVIRQDDVENFEMPVFDDPDMNQYPRVAKFPYPKPGTTLPVTSLLMFDVNGKSVTQLTPSQTVQDWGDYYLNHANWRGTNVFNPVWKNRVQNKALSDNCASDNSFVCSHSSTQELVSSTGWVGHYKANHNFPIADENSYFTVDSYQGYPHIQRVDAADDFVEWRTSGKFEVTDTGGGYTGIHFYDETFDWLYYTSTELDDDRGNGLPRIRNVWRVKGHGNDKARQCLTCALADCNWNTPSFSPNGEYIVMNCGGAANVVPKTTLHKKNDQGDYDYLRVLIDNAELEQTIDEYYFREQTFGSIELPGVEGHEWYYTMWKPENFDPNKKYPLLVEVYSGPGYQKAVDRFYFSWRDYVASSLDVIVMAFDGRGTGYRGDEIMHMVYKKLGQYEPIDQIDAARIVAEQNSFIDPSRKAIWGWSYGGYATTRTIEEDSDNVYRCGFAVAPVNDWKYYHAIYTEKFMQTPSDNEIGYDTSSNLRDVSNVRSHWFNMFHGTRDENVHFQNSAQLSKKLIDENIDFGNWFSADDDHSMGINPNNYKTIYKMLTRKMKRCFHLN